jgi:subtilisin family serine protease
MARFVMANRRAGKFLEAEKVASRQAIDTGFNRLFAANVDVVNDLNPADAKARRVMVFEADPEEIAAKAPTLSADVLVEPEILHFPVVEVAGMPAVAVLDVEAAAPAATFVATVKGSGAPLRGATVILFAVDVLNRQQQREQITNAAGMVSIPLSRSLRPTALVVLPAGGFWSMVFRNPVSTTTFDCPPIANVGPLDWWHKAFGILTFDANRGSGIKVGVIDTGAGPHGCLAHVISAGAFINGAHNPSGGADVDSHGSHVCGTIGARPVNGNQRAGIAPAATLMCARVFPGPDAGASQADIANAIDDLSRTRGADLINMSLGASSPSTIEHDAIVDALQRGTLCVCAAGNDGGAVSWPARFDEAVAVSAIGLKNATPPGSISAGRVPTDTSKHGAQNLYLANFSNFGSTVDCCAPGVGIVATVPERFGLTQPYAAMDGTSMASPAACGALAALLARSPLYLSLTGSARAEEARSILRINSRSIGLAATFQGAGMPQVP